MRALAGECKDAEMMTIMLRLANDFDKLAVAAARLSKVANARDR